MKKVLFVGEYNIVYREVSNFLTRLFSVQICEGDMLVDSNLVTVSNPDIILVNVLGMDEEKEEVLAELNTKCKDIPLACLVSSDEDVPLYMVAGIEKFRTLKLPASNEEIAEILCEMMGFRYDRESGVMLETTQQRKSILAIDDNPVQLRMLNEILKDEYDVMLATSAMKALTIIGKRVPDLILLDYDMPLCDGKMTLQMIREIEEAKEVPVIFLTAVKDAAHIKAVLELHPAGYLLKPAKSDMLREEIEKNMRK